MRLLLVSLIVRAASAAQLVEGAIYAGHYVCGGASWLLFHVERVTDDRVQAAFHFLYPSSTQHGVYSLTGKFQEGGRVLSMTPEPWLLESSGQIVPVGLMGVVSDDGQSYSGEVMHVSCGRFQVNRTTVDVVPPEQTVYFPSADSSKPTRQMTLKASASLVPAAAADGAASSAPREQLQMIASGMRGMVAEARQMRQAARSSAASSSQPRSTRPAQAASPVPPRPPTPPTPPTPPFETWPPVSMEQLVGMNEDDVAAALSSRIDASAFQEAYQLWSSLVDESRRRAAARRIIGEVVHGSAALVGGEESARTRQRHVLSTLAIFGGALPAAGRAIAAVLAADGADQEADVPFAEEQLVLTLSRSGCRVADAKLQVADSYLRIGDAANAARLLQELSESRPQWAHPLRRLASIARARGELKQAVQHLRAATTRAAHDIYSWVELGHVYKEAGKTRSALWAFREAQARHPQMVALRPLRQYISAAERMLATD